MTRLRVHLSHYIIVKSPGLLPMYYTVGELASELRIPDRTLRDWLEAGAPHHRDECNHIWINGVQFAQWVQQQRRLKHEHKLDDGSAYCFRCNEVVEIMTPRHHHIKGKLFLITGTCPQCGTTINRGARYATNDLQGKLPPDSKIPGTSH
ncbi:MAG: hypothetical protein M1485_05250 [Chloroflexi bacterium]|nr:hypothetical protein [Chloroflexota bacterium]